MELLNHLYLAGTVTLWLANIIIAMFIAEFVYYDLFRTHKGKK